MKIKEENTKQAIGTAQMNFKIMLSERSHEKKGNNLLYASTYIKFQNRKI